MTGLDSQLDDFKKTIVQINTYKSFTKSLANKFSVYEQSLEDFNLIKKRSEATNNEWSTSINFRIKDYDTGSFKSLEYNEFTNDHFKSFELELKNRQYQFLLLHAFEAFEKYLKFAASQIGYIKNGKSFSPTAFIQRLHVIIPTIPRVIKIRNENDKKLLDEINLLLTFSLIEQLRHQITHANGYAHDKDIFIKKCLDRIGRYNEGKPKLEYTDYINNFFGSRKYENLICLIEVKDNLKPFIYYDRLGDLIQELVSYILFINVYIKQHKATAT